MRLILRAFYLPLGTISEEKMSLLAKFFIGFWLLGYSNILQQEKGGERQWRQCLIDAPTPIEIDFYLLRGVSVFV